MTLQRPGLPLGRYLRGTNSLTQTIPRNSSEATALRAPSRWTARHVGAIRAGAVSYAPVIGAGDFARVGDDLDVWDAWPVQLDDGAPAVLETGDIPWMALASPRFSDPEERHKHARIHLMLQSASKWRDLGPAMPEGFSPGSREWSGSSVLAADRRTLTLFFTATGRRGEKALTFEQRLFCAQSTLIQDSSGVRCTDWRSLGELFERDPAHYMASDAGVGEVGTIKAFRDPGYFRDPADGARYIFFTGSLAQSASDYNGVIGAAAARPEGPMDLKLLPPLVSADALHNELERPHVVIHGRLYYLFCSTHSHVFNPQGPVGPTGLYGLVSGELTRGWKRLNGTGLVFANPPDAPKQAYSWLVLSDLSVTSFVDRYGGANADGAQPFGGSFAPMLRLRLDGDRAALAE